MDYMDRSITMKTRFSAIKNIWFKGESFDWGKHKDLSYLNSSFKVGDKIEFTGSQNIRKGSGTSYAITGATKAGQVFTIEDGPRVASGYTWYDLKGADWVADVGKFKIYTAPPPEPPPPPPPPADPTKELKERIVILEKEISGLRTALSDLEDKNTVLTGLIKAKDTKIKELGGKIVGLEEEAKELMEKYGTLMIEKNRIENESLGWQEKLGECKKQLEEGKENFIKVIVEWVKEVLAEVRRNRS
jgi:FtsZ-binding cell division protein ZapB